jgi:opacity protein-like surface antigen
MGKIKFGMMVVALLLSCSFIFADDELTPVSGWYVRFDAGISNALDPELKIPSGHLPADLGSSSLFGGGLGYSIVPGLRSDFTLTYRSGFQQISGFAAMPEGNADLHSLAALVSIHLDVLTTARVSPYGGFGIGLARNKLDRITITNPDGSILGTIDGKTATGFAWQLSAGADIQIANQWVLDVGYHYLSAGDYESQDLLILTDGGNAPGKTEGKFRSHELIASIQYTF